MGILYLSLSLYVAHVEGNCKFGGEDSDVESTVALQGLQYVDLRHPLTCSGSIVAWHFCYYTDNVGHLTHSYHAYLRVYRSNTSSQLQRVHDESVALELTRAQVGSNTFLCSSYHLNETDYLNVSMGDYLAAYIPPDDNQPLWIVGGDMPQSLLHRDTRDFVESFGSPTVLLSDLQEVEGGILHLYADVGK